jgi:hypothetical protein
VISQLHVQALFFLGENPMIPIKYETEWALEPVWKLEIRKKIKPNPSCPRD